MNGLVKYGVGIGCYIAAGTLISDWKLAVGIVLIIVGWHVLNTFEYLHKHNKIEEHSCCQSKKN